MLVKLAFAMQRLKKYLKKFLSCLRKMGEGTIFRFYGGHSCYEGGHRADGGPPLPPQGKTLLIFCAEFIFTAYFPLEQFCNFGEHSFFLIWENLHIGWKSPDQSFVPSFSIDKIRSHSTGLNISHALAVFILG